MARREAVIIGVGDGLSAALARELAPDHALTLAARSGEKMRAVAEETGGRVAKAVEIPWRRSPGM
jgi:short-subunit dehydrogenase